MVRRWTSLDESRMIVYVKRASDGELLPVRDKLLYYGHSKWNTVMVQLDIKNGFKQVIFTSLPPCWQEHLSFVPQIMSSFLDCSLLQWRHFISPITNHSLITGNAFYHGICDNLLTSTSGQLLATRKLYRKTSSGVTRALIGGGGGYIHIFARLISIEMDLKTIVGQNTNIWIYTL